MTRYAILAAAILVGVLIGWVLSRPKKSSDETVYVDARRQYWYLPWLGGLMVLVIGLFLLADPTRAPKDTTYEPAVIKDGIIQPGTFTSNADQENATNDQ